VGNLFERKWGEGLKTLALLSGLDRALTVEREGKLVRRSFDCSTILT
jgi:hypothetical protein